MAGQCAQVPSVEDIIKKIKKKKKKKKKEQEGDIAVVSMTDMNEVSEALRRIAAEAGLGVAILVAWQHGLEIGHIPLEHDQITGKVKERQAEVIAATDDCPYVFVHVPIRRIRNDKLRLAQREIMNPDADPAWFIYHEDGLIGTFSFDEQDLVSAKLTGEDIREILDTLSQQGVLMRANIDNRQIQFKDLAAKRRIEESGEKVYVRVENQPLEKGRLPIELNWEDAWDSVVKRLEKKSACNYCSAQALTPHEVTIHSAHLFAQAGRLKDDLVTVRNYQLGFTFAPFGDPREVCHFLAWDFPHINDLVMNMEPQAYSFSDLIRLVRLINRDIREFCRNKVDPPSEPVSGICNHWGGNSIYHQHYQFVRIAGFPLARAFNAAQRIVADDGVIQVRKCTSWQSPAFLITSSEPGREQEVMDVADRVAREWRIMGEGDDRSYGNGIVIRNHTQNLFVTAFDGKVSAIFIPRDRGRIDTRDPQNLIDGKLIQKRNAGTLEMMGYFLIDDPDDFAKLEQASADDRKRLGDSWLSELAPDDEEILDFETNIGICLNAAVTRHEKRIDEIASDTPEDMRQEVWALASSIQRDQSLDHEQRGHLYRELLSAVLEYRTGDSTQQQSAE
jgi:hypothetical protein